MKKEEKNPTELTPTPWRGYWADLVGSWLPERCDHGSAALGHKTLAADLLRDFTRWCDARGIAPLSVRMFGDLLRERGVIYAGKDANGRVMRAHVRLKGPASSDALSTVQAACAAAMPIDPVMFGG